MIAGMCGIGVIGSMVMMLMTLSGWALMPMPREPAELMPRPVLFHLPGVSGDTWFDRQFLRALKTGGFDAEMRFYDWTGERGFFGALGNEPANRQQAAHVAQMILRQRQAEPDRPIVLTAESGGTGILIWALELLPAEVEVDVAVLLAPAVSPDYDLSKALSHVRRCMLVYHSPRDLIILGAGTELFGTVDRVYTPAAGLVGFRMPDTADPHTYAKLEQRRYNPAWLREYGHFGGHVGSILPRFASGHVAPTLVKLLNRE